MGADVGPDLNEDAQETRCARHPNVETTLLCGRCGTPICPRCLVQTPVGARCPTCANVRRIPTVDVKPIYLARGLGAAIVSGLVVGIVWAVVIGGQAGGVAGFFIFFVAMGIGWAIGESVSAATNRKRARALQACAVIGVVLSYFVRNIAVGLPLVPLTPHPDLWGFIAVALASMFAAGRLSM